MLRSAMVIFLMWMLASCAPMLTYTEADAKRAFVRLIVSFDFEPVKGITVTGQISGSGAFIRHPMPGAVLTAAHVCAPAFPGAKNVRLRLDSPTGDTYTAKVVKVDEANDLCLLRANASVLNPIQLSPRPPAIGEPVSYFGAPAGYMDRNVYPHLDGRYNGTSPDGLASYTLPVVGGASGSPIVLRNGTLVGVVVASFRRFNMLSFSPSYAQVVKFLSL